MNFGTIIGNTGEKIQGRAAGHCALSGNKAALNR
jgi:hypothetical protein